MKILITGASGFIGLYLSNYLTKKGFEILLISKENGFDLSIKGWTKKIKEKKIDIIIHLAQSSMYRDFENGVEDMFDINVSATFELLLWAKLNKVKKFIYTSSGSVYKNSSEKLNEKSPLGENSFYSRTKIISEQLIFSFSEYFETIILRLFTVYGKHQKNKLIPNIIKNIYTGSKIVLSGGKGIIISPIYIDDLNKVFEKICTIDKNLNKEIINISGDETISLSEIVDIVSSIINKGPVIEINQENVKSLTSDNLKLRTLLPKNFVFRPIKDGLLKILN